MHEHVTLGRFGYIATGGQDEDYPTSVVVRVLVKSNLLNNEADTEISPHLMTAAEIDEFIDQSIMNLRAVQAAAKGALERGNPS